jgi:hypothetical protein
MLVNSRKRCSKGVLQTQFQNFVGKSFVRVRVRACVRVCVCARARARDYRKSIVISAILLNTSRLIDSLV